MVSLRRLEALLKASKSRHNQRHLVTPWTVHQQLILNKLGSQVDRQRILLILLFVVRLQILLYEVDRTMQHSHLEGSICIEDGFAYKVLNEDHIHYQNGYCCLKSYVDGNTIEVLTVYLQFLRVNWNTFPEGVDFADHQIVECLVDELQLLHRRIKVRNFLDSLYRPLKWLVRLGNHGFLISGELATDCIHRLAFACYAVLLGIVGLYIVAATCL